MSIIQGLKSAAGRVPAKMRIATGQVLLLIAVLLLAVALGIVPDERRAIAAGRSKLCEAVAVQCSASLERNEIGKLRGTFEPMLRRDRDVVSAAVCRQDGTVLEQFGDRSGEADSNFVVPIWNGDRKWGSLEIRFHPPGPSGFLGFLQPQLRLIGFVSMTCLVLYLPYLRTMLRHLDPSKVVPPRVRSALDTLAEGLLVLNQEGRIVLANQSLAEILGKAPDQLMGTHVGQLPWDQSKDVAVPWDDALQGGEGCRGVIMRLRGTRSVLRTLAVNCSPILGETGDRRGVLMSLDDVTALEQNESELRKSKDEAVAANRAKSEFLARMSHEIRTPMNAILGFSDILRRGYDQSPAERQEYLDTIHSSGQHLLELINDILDLSKIEAGKLQVETCRCSPRELIGQVVAVMSVRAEQKGIAIETHWNGQIPETIETDPTRLRQALTNLVGNAVKFTESGGIRVVGRIQTILSRPKLVIEVIDSGIGMKGDVLARIFEPFAQGDTSITRRFGGTGLGLSISKQIAEALGGGISVASECGRGSTFTLTVDAGSLKGVATAESHLIARTPAADLVAEAPMARLDGLRVLLADDGASNRRLISLVLGRAGAVLETAEDGQAAVEMAIRGNYSLILMDMQMPLMDGYAAAARLRQEGLTVPIIALTAHAMQGDEDKCRAAGCTGFLTKPIEMELLLRTVAETVGAGPVHGVVGGPPIRSTLPEADPEFSQIIDEFIERLQLQVGAILTAWARGDLKKLGALAHWIKGSGGTVGFDSLTEPARALEQAVRDQRFDQIESAISRIEELTARIAMRPKPLSTSAFAGPMTSGIAA